MLKSKVKFFDLSFYKICFKDFEPWKQKTNKKQNKQTTPPNCLET